MQNALGLDDTVVEAIDYDAVAGAADPLAQRVVDGADARVEVRSIVAECKAGVKCLLGIHQCARVRKVRHLARRGIENRERLLIVRLKSAVARIDSHNIAPVGRDRDGHGQAVDALRRARHRKCELFAGGQVARLRCERTGRTQCAGEDNEENGPRLHGETIANGDAPCVNRR